MINYTMNAKCSKYAAKNKSKKWWSHLATVETRRVVWTWLIVNLKHCKKTKFFTIHVQSNKKPDHNPYFIGG